MIQILQFRNEEIFVPSSFPQSSAATEILSTFNKINYQNKHDCLFLLHCIESNEVLVFNACLSHVLSCSILCCWLLWNKRESVMRNPWKCLKHKLKKCLKKNNFT